MRPSIAARTRSKRERLRRLAIVFKVEIRLKIVLECYLRAMSPNDFLNAFGGGSIERVAQIFDLLERQGWLRHIGYKRREPRGRGNQVEKLYRATELPFFDAETWSLLPFSVRLTYSWCTFTATAKELRKGVETTFSEGLPSRPLTCTPLELDDVGWSRLIGRLAAEFEAIFEEQVDAKMRCAKTPEKLIRASILQLGFEVPRSDERLPPRLADGGPEPPIPLFERLAPICADDLCMQILAELNSTDMSVKQFHQEFGNDVSEGMVRHRFDRLRDLAWIVIVEQIRKRAAYENIFRATRPTVVGGGAWADVPEGVGETKAWRNFVRLSEFIKEAIVTGTFDLRDDRHFSWSIVLLDRDGWEKVVSRMEALARFARGEQQLARKRIDAGAKPMTMVLGLTAIQASPNPGKGP